MEKNRKTYTFLIENPRPTGDYDDEITEDISEYDFFIAQEGNFPEGYLLKVWTKNPQAKIGNVADILEKHKIRASLLENPDNKNQ